jgi:hypothetical protein
MATVVVVIGALAPAAAWCGWSDAAGGGRGRVPAMSSSLGFIAIVHGSCLAYSPFDEWRYLRFLLHTLPRLLILGRLDWPPAAEAGHPVGVRFYDPRDRQRCLDGDTVKTFKEPNASGR